MYNPSGVQGPQPLYCLPAVTPAVRLAGPLRAGAGAGSWPPGLLPGLALFSSSRPEGAALLFEIPPAPPALRGGLFRCCRQQQRGGSRVAAAFPRASRRPGGRRSARRRTIPRRRSAAPSGCRRCPFVGCGLAAKPALGSPWGWRWPVAAASGVAAFFFSRGLGSSEQKEKTRTFPRRKI